MTLDDAVGILVSAAQARKDQWEGVGEGITPSDLIDDLWESQVNGTTEAKFMIGLIGEAIEVVNKTRPIE